MAKFPSKKQITMIRTWRWFAAMNGRGVTKENLKWALDHIFRESDVQPDFILAVQKMKTAHCLVSTHGKMHFNEKGWQVAEKILHRLVGKFHDEPIRYQEAFIFVKNVKSVLVKGQSRPEIVVTYLKDAQGHLTTNRDEALVTTDWRDAKDYERDFGIAKTSFRQVVKPVHVVERTLSAQQLGGLFA